MIALGVLTSTVMSSLLVYSKCIFFKELDKTELVLIYLGGYHDEMWLGTQ